MTPKQTPWKQTRVSCSGYMHNVQGPSRLLLELTRCNAARIVVPAAVRELFDMTNQDRNILQTVAIFSPGTTPLDRLLVRDSGY